MGRALRMATDSAQAPQDAVNPFGATLNQMSPDRQEV